jgi:hypothetical protein
LGVLDFKQVHRQFVGFPSGERHTCNGWKFKHQRTIITSVCDACAEQYLVSIKKDAPRNTWIAAAVAVALLTFSIIGEDFDDPVRSLSRFSFFIFMGALFFFFKDLFRCFADKGEVLYTLHRKAEKKLLGKALRMNYNEPKKIPEKGGVFHVPAKYWEPMAKSIAELETQTGWSYIYYVRDFSPDGPQTCTPEQGAEFLKVPHLGVVLDAPELGRPASE